MKKASGRVNFIRLGIMVLGGIVECIFDFLLPKSAWVDVMNTLRFPLLMGTSSDMS